MTSSATKLWNEWIGHVVHKMNTLEDPEKVVALTITYVDFNARKCLVSSDETGILLTSQPFSNSSLPLHYIQDTLSSLHVSSTVSSSSASASSSSSSFSMPSIPVPTSTSISSAIVMSEIMPSERVVKASDASMDVILQNFSIKQSNPHSRLDELKLDVISNNSPSGLHERYYFRNNCLILPHKSISTRWDKWEGKSIYPWLIGFLSTYCDPNNNNNKIARITITIQDVATCARLLYQIQPENLPLPCWKLNIKKFVSVLEEEEQPSKGIKSDFPIQNLYVPITQAIQKMYKSVDFINSKIQKCGTQISPGQFLLWGRITFIDGNENKIQTLIPLLINLSPLPPYASSTSSYGYDASSSGRGVLRRYESSVSLSTKFAESKFTISIPNQSFLPRYFSADRRRRREEDLDTSLNIKFETVSDRAYPKDYANHPDLMSQYNISYVSEINVGGINSIWFEEQPGTKLALLVNEMCQHLHVHSVKLCDASNVTSQVTGLKLSLAVLSFLRNGKTFYMNACGFIPISSTVRMLMNKVYKRIDKLKLSNLIDHLYAMDNDIQSAIETLRKHHVDKNRIIQLLSPDTSQFISHYQLQQMALPSLSSLSSSYEIEHEYGLSSSPNYSITSTSLSDISKKINLDLSSLNNILQKEAGNKDILVSTYIYNTLIGKTKEDVLEQIVKIYTIGLNSLISLFEKEEGIPMQKCYRYIFK